MFALANNSHSMETRSIIRFKELKAKTNRYKKSAIPYMKRLLNDEHSKVAKILNI